MKRLMRAGAILFAAVALCGVHAPAAHAQSFAFLVGDANHAELSGQYLEAAKLYDQAYAVSGFDPVALALAAVSSGHGGDRAGAVSYLRRATAEGFVDPRFLHILRGDTALAKFAGDTAWSNAVSAAEHQYDSIDKPLRSELLDMATRDHAIRLIADSLLSSYGSGTPPADTTLGKVAAADMAIQTHLAELVQEHGWPGRKLVGDDGAHAASLVLQHVPVEVQRHMLPLVQAAVEHHDARPSDLALLEDRLLVADGKPQRYGSQLDNSKQGAAAAVAPIENEPCVDVRRAAVGLEPLAVYLQRFGVEYTLPPGASKERCAK